MRKLEVKDAAIIRIGVQQEILRSEKARYDNRLHGILFVCFRLSYSEEARIFGHGPRTIYWVRRFEESGLAGLEESPRPGRPSIVDEDIRSAVALDFRCSLRELGYSQNLWDGKLRSHNVFHQTGYPLRSCKKIENH